MSDHLTISQVNGWVFNNLKESEITRQKDPGLLNKPLDEWE